ncbi:MAG: FHA domain-containing protein [Chloroflexi bacterium]|nr:FHA domain-containing protein [Chloroflexota bacterium]
MEPELTIKLMVMSGPDDGLEIVLNHSKSGEPLPPELLGKYTIGRRDNSDVCVPFDTLVSRLHATLHYRADGLFLVDEGSRNGTFVGRRRVKEPESVNIGQMFRVGQTWLRVQSIE